MTYQTTVKTGSYWSDERGGIRRRGVRIERGRSFAWFPDEHILAIAETLADYLERPGEEITYTTNSYEQENTTR